MIFSVNTFFGYFSDDEQQKIQVRIKPVDESKKESNPDLTDEQLKKLTTTLTLMSPASVVIRVYLWRILVRNFPPKCLEHCMSSRMRIRTITIRRC